jgi:hypothetical protein
MPVVVAGIVAAVIGAVLAVGGGMALTSSQGGGSFPDQQPGSITVYGSN